MWYKCSVAILAEVRSQFMLILDISRKGGKGQHSHYVALTTPFLHLQYRKIVGFCRQTFWNLVHKVSKPLQKVKLLQIFPGPCLLAHLKMHSEKSDRNKIISEEKWPYLWLLNRCHLSGVGGFMKIILSEILKIDVWSRSVSWEATLYRKGKEILGGCNDVFCGCSSCLGMCSWGEEKNDDKSWRILIRLGLCCKLKRKGGEVGLTDEVLERFLIFTDLSTVYNSVLPPTAQEEPDPFSLLVFLYWSQ